MKEIKMDFETYVQELENVKNDSFNRGGVYALKSMLKGEPYPEDIQKAIEDIQKAEEKSE